MSLVAGLLSFVVLLAIVGIAAYFVKKALAEQLANDAAPIVKARATVMRKRVEVTGSGNSAKSQCRALFDVEDHGRVELPIPGDEYGFLNEGDTGTLTYQRLRYKGFARDV
jgi:hypothetical protein